MKMWDFIQKHPASSAALLTFAGTLRSWIPTSFLWTIYN